MTPTTNAENVQYKSRICLIVELVLPFNSSPKVAREVKKSLSPNFKKITSRYFTLLNILVRIVGLILLLNSK